MLKNKFILKTIADCSIAGLISIGAFQSPTFLIESLTGYLILVLLLFTIIFVMATYALRYREKQAIIGLSLALGLSIIEVSLIGYALGKNIEMIIVVWFITIPSIIIFDKILG